MDSVKRKRINRIKKAIVFFMFAMIIVPTVLCIILTLRLGNIKAELSDAGREIERLKKELENNERRSEALGVYAEKQQEESGRLKEELIKTEKKAAQMISKNVVPEDGLRVYLTFDDGPSDNTDEILNILRKYGVKAGFFVNGRTDEESLKRYKRITDEGHTLGMHSYSHRYAELYSSLDAFQADFVLIKNLIKLSTGVEPKFYRFPGGSSNSVAGEGIMREYIDFLHRNEVDYLDWNIDSQDSGGGKISADIIVENVFKDMGLYKTNVVLLHDGFGHKETVKALPKIIERARDMGAVLLPLDEEAATIKHFK